MTHDDFPILLIISERKSNDIIHAIKPLAYLFEIKTHPSNNEEGVISLKWKIDTNETLQENERNHSSAIGGIHQLLAVSVVRYFSKDIFSDEELEEFLRTNFDQHKSNEI
jgi:hypothetical protein